MQAQNTQQKLQETSNHYDRHPFPKGGEKHAQHCRSYLAQFFIQG